MKALMVVMALCLLGLMVLGCGENGKVVELEEQVQQLEKENELLWSILTEDIPGVYGGMVAARGLLSQTMEKADFTDTWIKEFGDRLLSMTEYVDELGEALFSDKLKEAAAMQDERAGK